MLDLAGDVIGRRILDVGCGAGPLLASLRDRGAVVTGIEPSAKMLDLARQRLGDATPLHQGGLGGDPLPFPDAAFDDVVACLVLHYLQDWKAPLAELRRVLVPGGRLIVAVNHSWRLYPAGVSFKPKPRRMLSLFAFARSAVKEFKRPSKVVEDAGHFKS